MLKSLLICKTKLINDKGFSKVQCMYGTLLCYIRTAYMHNFELLMFFDDVSNISIQPYSAFCNKVELLLLNSVLKNQGNQTKDKRCKSR